MPSGKLALWCWYHGGPFRGYQSQARGPTVQDAITAALRGANIDTTIIGSGRTDLGVHARMQVVSCRVPEPVPLDGLEHRLRFPAALGVIHCVQAAPKFHPQWSCLRKEYRYRLLLAADPAWEPFAWRTDVDPEEVTRVLGHALGTHDFWAFHEKSSARRPRTIDRVDAKTNGALVELCIEGDGFGRYQVRYLVGGAVAVARGELSEDDYVAGISHAREFAGVKAPAHGLILWDVRYPPQLDPFSADIRARADGLPSAPPFSP